MKARTITVPGWVVLWVPLVLALTALLTAGVALVRQDLLPVRPPGGIAQVDPNGQGAQVLAGDAAGATGTRSEPLPVGVTFLLADWEITLGRSNLDATERLLAHDPWNQQLLGDTEAAGMLPVLVPVDLTYVGGGSGSPYELGFTYVAADGNTHYGSNGCGRVPDELDYIGEMFTGASNTGNALHHGARRAGRRWDVDAAKPRTGLRAGPRRGCATATSVRGDRMTHLQTAPSHGSSRSGGGGDTMTGPRSFEGTLLRELRALTQRAGLNRTELPADIAGTQLEALFGLQGQPWASARATLLAHVRSVSADMSPEQQLALEVAFGTHPKANQPTLDQRIDWLARSLHCSDRTVRRRIAAALQILTRATAAMPNGTASDEPISELGWRIRRVSIVLRLDTPGPELHHSRQITAERDGLDQIIGRFTLPRLPEDTPSDRTPTVDVLYGGQLGEVARIGDEYFRYELRLPRALATGDTHGYSVAYRLPPAAPIAPYVALVPLFNTYEFCEMRVRFDMRRAPVSIWRLAHVPPPALAAEVPGENRLKVDGSGEVHVEFVRPRQGLGYGVAWDFADDIDRPS